MVDDIIVRAMFHELFGANDGLVPDDSIDDGIDGDRPPGGVAITLRGLAKRFGDQPVLHGIDLHVPSGQFLTVIGKSGCGKSTLLRILAGLDEATSGEVRFDGHPARQSPHVARLMFQEPRLLPWAGVLGNVEVGLGARRSEPRADQRARAKLAAVGLDSRADDWPSVLSGGQKQRVALARALASSPHFLALDEPLGALDALTRIEMQGLLERVWREQRFTAVLVTHDVTEAIMLGDRVVLIEDGIVKLEIDVPLERPRRRGSREVAALEQRILRHLFADGGFLDRPSLDRSVA
jgi:sulfonate transport system ATP-binding protein